MIISKPQRDWTVRSNWTLSLRRKPANFFARGPVVADPARWDAVLNGLDRAGSPIRAALESPLYLSLAKTIYETGAGAPSELVNATRFGEGVAVQAFLLDSIVRTSYSPRVALRSKSDEFMRTFSRNATLRDYDTEDARKWLGTVAYQLKARPGLVQSQAFSWFDIARWPIAATQAGILAVVVALVATWVVLGLAEAGGGDVTWSTVLLISILDFALLPYAFAARAVKSLRIFPSRPSWQRSAATAGLLGDWIATALTAAPVCLLLGLLLSASAVHLDGILMAAVVSATISLAVVLRLIYNSSGAGQLGWWVCPPAFLCAWLSGDIKWTVVTGSVVAMGFGLLFTMAAIVKYRSYQPDHWPDICRGTVTYSCLATSFCRASDGKIRVAVEIGTLLALLLGVLACGLMALIMFGEILGPGGGKQKSMLIREEIGHAVLDGFIGTAVGTIMAILVRQMGVLDGGFVIGSALFIVAALLPSAGFRYLCVIFTGATAGLLPWRLSRFLLDAENRGLLRRPSSGYEFRHAQLLNRLAAP
jgi:hypothetical protein